MSKKSIRFYKDHEVRSIWDEEQSQWWFSIVDVVAAVTESPNPRKYWSVLKTRLKKAGNELTTRCSQLKMTAADGKRYATVLKRRISSTGSSIATTPSTDRARRKPTRIWLDLILKKKLGLCIDWSKIGKRDYLNAQQQVLK